MGNVHLRRDQSQNTKIPVATNFFQASSLQHFSQRALLTANPQPVFDLPHLPAEMPVIESWHDRTLNRDQQNAVRKILAAPDLAMVQGPPGTGKTTVIAEAAYQFARQGKKVLIASQANLAVDNVLEMLANTPVIRPVRLGKKKKIDEGLQLTSGKRLTKVFVVRLKQASILIAPLWLSSSQSIKRL